VVYRWSQTENYNTISYSGYFYKTGEKLILTDTNNNVQVPLMPEQSQNIGIENNIVQPMPESIINQQPVATIDNNPMAQNPGNVLSIENLTQNNSMVSPTPVVEPIISNMPENIMSSQQPQMPEPINIDNNFKEITSDFQPLQNQNVVQELNQSQPMKEPQIMSPSAVAPIEVPQIMNNQVNPLEGIQTPIMEQPIQPAMSENVNIMQPEQIVQPLNTITNIDNLGVQQPIQEPIMTQQPVVEPIIQPMPEINMQQPVVENSVPQKDILPVINTLKAVGVSLETFGYTVRITDEDLPTSYKITIEVEK